MDGVPYLFKSEEPTLDAVAWTTAVSIVIETTVELSLKQLNSRL